MTESPGIEETEVIRLELPHGARFVHVARVVVGGLAARLDLPYESLDDLQLAVETILAEERYRVAEQVALEVRIGGPRVEILIAPLDLDAVRADLAAPSDRIELGVLLAAVVDDVGFEQRNGGAWLRLGKRVPRGAGA